MVRTIRPKCGIAEIHGIGLDTGFRQQWNIKSHGEPPNMTPKQAPASLATAILQSSGKARMLLDAGQLSAYILRGKPFFLNAP